jgi:hypothetical protein
MFEKLEAAPRNDAGALANPWLRIAFEALVLAKLSLWTEHVKSCTAAHMDAMWASWWEPRNPLNPVIDSMIDTHNSINAARWAENLTADAARDEGWKSK